MLMKGIIINLFAALFFFPVISGDKIAYALEGTRKNDNVKTVKKIDTCTERCHVNFMAYENKFDPTGKVEIFKHQSHSFDQDLDCKLCHDKTEVNIKGHGKLIIGKNDCLKCHHVELEDFQCKRCHNEIDENPMKYKKEVFLHGFTVDSEFDCAQCHNKDPKASSKEGINCVQCHHTTPDLDCVKCHKEDVKRLFNTDPKRKDSLSWTVSFEHSQHPEKDMACIECHAITNENDAGIVAYNLNCTECHHVSGEKKVCMECHKGPSDYIKGDVEVAEISTMPDTMSRSVKCEDCHKFDEAKLQFREVKENCIECHNNNYGKLFDAWQSTIKNRVKRFNDHIYELYEEDLLATIKGPDVNENEKKQKMSQEDLSGFMEKTGDLVGRVTKYGIHNFNMTRTVMDYLENKTFKLKIEE